MFDVKTSNKNEKKSCEKCIRYKKEHAVIQNRNIESTEAFNKIGIDIFGPINL